jgi:DNA recombination protein RmuC
MFEIVALLLVLAALAGGGVLLVRLLRTELGRLRVDSATQLAELRTESATQLATRTADVDRRLEAFTSAVDRRISEFDQRVDRRLESSTRTATEIHQQLGKLGETSTQMLDRANDLRKLEQALRPPKARGGFGELLLANLLADTFPGDKFELQYGFKGGERVDAVIRLDRALVPIDAKFPLDNFERVVEAETDGERELHAKQFCRDVKHHVDAIAQKYIRPEEGTYEFALMYLPAEAVYYEIVCNRLGGSSSPLAYALERNVIPVSPSTLHAYLLVLILGFKGLRIEQHATEVMAYCAQLGKEFGRFKEDFELVGTHLGRAQSKYVESEKHLGRFETKLERAAESDPPQLRAEAEALAALPRALDAA